MRRLFVLAFAGVALAGCAATDIETESRNFEVQRTSAPAPGESAGVSDQVTQLVRNSGPSYVTLVVSDTNASDQTSVARDTRRSPVTAGSGFLVDPSGVVMTAAHVAVKKGNTVSARAANGRLYSGTVIAIQPDNDMALIKLRGMTGRAVTPGDNQCLARGNMVYSLGRPHEQGDTARLGQFEAMHFGHQVRYAGTNGQYGYPDAMVLRLSTQKGESGGPLFNGEGHLVGMVVSTLYDNQGQPLNLAHAVPSRALASFLCANGECQGPWQGLTSPSSCGG